jgi:hypothetical protein
MDGWHLSLAGTGFRQTSSLLQITNTKTESHICPSTELTVLVLLVQQLLYMSLLPDFLNSLKSSKRYIISFLSGLTVGLVVPE